MANRVFTTERLLVREINETDWQHIVAAGMDPDLTERFNLESWTAGMDLRTYLEKTRASAIERLDFKFAVDLNNRFAGACWLQSSIHAPKKASISFFILPQFWGSGYASELVKGLLAYAFDHLGFSLIVADCDRDDLASRAVLEKNGLILTNLTPKAVRRATGFSDVAGFELRKNEWLRQKKLDATISIVPAELNIGMLVR